MIATLDYLVLILYFCACAFCKSGLIFYEFPLFALFAYFLHIFAYFCVHTSAKSNLTSS
ncbi:hypothetical protein C8J56DRAFT_961153 [Mycena floridula]|nr:hypothetical protein C8J56DRAFT_961153 [Mycena floridula]